MTGMKSRSAELHESLSQILLRLRDEAHLSQNQMATKSGVSQSQISRLEAGTHSPSLDSLIRLAETLEVPLSRILEEAEGDVG